MKEFFVVVGVVGLVIFAIWFTGSRSNECRAKGGVYLMKDHVCVPSQYIIEVGK